MRLRAPAVTVTDDAQERYPACSMETVCSPTATVLMVTGVTPTTRPSSVTRAPLGRDSTRSPPVRAVLSAGRAGVAATRGLFDGLGVVEARGAAGRAGAVARRSAAIRASVTVRVGDKSLSAMVTVRSSATKPSRPTRTV